MRSSRRRNELLSRGSGHMHGGSSPFPMVRWTFFCLLLLAWSARAEQEVVWEPARVLDAEQIAVSGAFVPLAIPTFFDNFRYPFLQDDESVIWAGMGCIASVKTARSASWPSPAIILKEPARG